MTGNATEDTDWYAPLLDRGAEQERTGIVLSKEDQAKEIFNTMVEAGAWPWLVEWPKLRDPS